MKTSIARRVKTILSEVSFPGFSREQMFKIVEEIENALNKPPKIAIIGETGVGKTTTINALFNKGLPISHIEACTKEAEELRIEIKDDKNITKSIIIYDMPGLGEDIDSDIKHLETYLKILPECDVVIWILKADTRTMTQYQISLRDTVLPALKDKGKLVIAINQVDLIQPGNWNDRYNLPSKMQERSIIERKKYIIDKTSKIVKISKDQIVIYSALKRYRLLDLLESMLNACPIDRAWILEDRAQPANFLDLVDTSEKVNQIQEVKS